MRKILLLTVCILGLCISTFEQASAQVGAAPTVLAVRDLLQTALDGLNNTIKSAGGEVKSAGDSLQANAQNVIADINATLGSKLNLTFDKLDKQEQQLVADAQLLTKQISVATNSVIINAGDQARFAIAEADITAYNTSYSLPCRDQTPRFVYAQPAEIRVGADRPEIKIRGNFLAFGDAPQVTVGDTPGSIIARSDNEMLVRIPQKVLDGIDVERSVAVSATPYAQRRTNLWVYCYSSTKKLDHPLSVPTVLKPKVSITIVGTIHGTVDMPHSVNEDYAFDNGTGDNCDASFEADKNYCMETGRVLDSWTGPNVTSQNGNDTGIRSVTRSGDRCLYVAAHIAGKGYSFSIPNPLGPKIANCNGRGWLTYKLVLQGHEILSKQLAPVPISGESLDGSQRSFVFHYGPILPDAANPSWQYDATITIASGHNVPEKLVISNANPNPGRVHSHIVNGDLAVEVLQ